MIGRRVLPSSGPNPYCMIILFLSQNLRVKIKCTFVQALRLCTGCTAHRGSRGIALLFLDRGTRRGEGSTSRPGRSIPPGKNRYPLYRGWAPGPVWTGAENLAPTGIRSPDRPAHSQSLYRLHYPAHGTCVYEKQIETFAFGKGMW